MTDPTDRPDPAMRVVAIIPARGGSKGISRKNVQPVGGVPLVVRTVRSARAARSVDAVYVSTDDPEIARLAREAGAAVVDRPSEHSGDDASSEAALLHALDVVAAHEGAEPAITVFLQCTSPFTRPEDVDAAVAAVRDDGADVAFTASRAHHFGWRIGPDGAAVGVNHDAARRPRRQDRDPEYVENGAVYALRTAGFRIFAHRFFGRVVVVEMPAARSLEIDDADELTAARLLAGWVDRAHHPTRVAGLRALVFDFDGVLTDNGVLTQQDGTESVRSDRSDGMGIELLRAAGVPMVVISKEQNPVVTARCRKLGLDVVQGCDDKVAALEEWLTDRGIEAGETGFVGNDINDLACMARVGCGIAVADAHPSVLAAADLVLGLAGGRGAVRELADLVLATRQGA
ncbi:MAG: acylneuraminate cytidylyltransferase [Acidimicrobiia bacterium]|jgi:N-acylneuraminate cytidylyltransferase